MMKSRILLVFIFLLGLYSCHDITVGYLETDDALYSPDSMVVRRELDPIQDYMMLQSGADWASVKISGGIGTSPMQYEITNVTATDGGDVDLFMEQIRIIGGGRFYFPSKDIKAPNGKYKLSIRITNPGYSSELKDIFTVIIK